MFISPDIQPICRDGCGTTETATRPRPAMANHDGDIHATKPFPSLKKLIIKKMAEWEYSQIPECDVFSNLEEVCIIDCPKLIGELPKQLSSLQSLEISGCDKLVLPNVQLRIFNGNNQQLTSLRKLKVRALKNLKELYLEINRLPSLENLEIDDCGSLLPFPVSCYLPQ